MKPALSSIFAVCLAAGFAATAAALEPPRVIPESATVSKPADQVFNTLKEYFSDIGLSKFNLISANNATHTIVAKQNGIDNARWSQWAACKTDPMDMLYRFSDGTVTVTATAAPAARNTTFVTITADFEGTYELASQTMTLECISTGALEQDILAVAGATAAASSR